MTAAYTVDLKLKTMAKALKRKYPTDDSDSRNRTRGTDEILTGTPKRRVDIVYKTQKDEDGYPTGYSTRTKTVTRFNRGPEGLESKVVRSKTKKVSDRRTSSTDPYAPSVQKKGGAIKKYQGEGEVTFPKKIDITAASDSTNVNMPGIKAFTPRDPEWVNYKKGPGQLRADEIYKKKQALDARRKLNTSKVGGSIKKYQGGGGITAADKIAAQRALNEKRKAEAQARTEKAKADARAKIDQAQKNKPIVKPAEPVAPAVTPNRKSDSEYRTVIANPKIATIEVYNNKKVLRDSDRTRKNGNRVVVQKTKEGDTVTRVKKVYNPGKETLTTKTKTYDRGNRKATIVKTKNTTSTKPKPIKPIWGDPHTLKKGGPIKKKK